MDQPGFVIRPSCEADIPAITAIYAGEVQGGIATFELEPPSEATMAGRRQVLLDGDFPYLVAERGADVLGYAYAGPYRPRPAYRWTVEDSVYVAASARGQGVGRALLARIIAESEAAGFRLMVAVISDTRPHGSIRLHEALGFSHAGRLDGVGFKHGRWLPTVLMQRPLGEGAASPPA